jgi:hypothetical protein
MPKVYVDAEGALRYRYGKLRWRSAVDPQSARAVAQRILEQNCRLGASDRWNGSN